MGTFKMPVGAVVKGGAWTTSGGTDVDVLNGGVGSMTQTSVGQAICPPTTFVTAPAPGTYSLDCSPAGAMVLDGTTLVSISMLPPGFTVTSLQVEITRLVVANPGPNSCLSAFRMTYNGAEVLNNPGIAPATYDPFVVQIPPLPLPSPLELFRNHWACEQAFVAANTANTGCGPLPYSDASLSYQSFYLQGTYEAKSKVLSVSFANGRDLRFDNDSRDYSAPHWINPTGG